MACLLGTSHLKVLDEDVIAVRRTISALIDVAMKKFLRSSYAVLCALARHKLRTVVFVEWRSSVRRWDLPLEKTV